MKSLVILPITLCLALLARPAHAETVLLADGQSLSGTIRAGETAGGLSLDRVGAATLPLKIEDLVGIDFGRSPAVEPITVTLTTGERLAGRLSFGKPGQVTVLRSHGAWTAPLSLCASLRLSAPPPPAGPRDLLLLGNGDRVEGRLLDIRDGKVSFQTTSGKLSLDLKRVAAFTRRITPGDGAGASDVGGRTRVRLSLTTGEEVGGTWEGLAGAASRPPTADSEPRAQSPEPEHRDQIRFTSAWGARLSIPVESVSRLMVQNGRCVFVSDMRPVEARQTGYLDSSEPHRVNESVGGRPLQLGGERFSRGLGVRPRSELTYELAGGYQTFAATIGIDAEVGGAGSVIFRVYGDDRALYESPVLRGGDEPRAVRVETRGILLLRLVVDFADNGDIGDHADWANARLLR